MNCVLDSKRKQPEVSKLVSKGKKVQLTATYISCSDSLTDDYDQHIGSSVLFFPGITYLSFMFRSTARLQNDNKIMHNLENIMN